jgi:branched-chain amino acid transport system substrate-binding protein
MTITRRAVLGATAAAALPVRFARAQTPTIRIGVLNDQSGPYRDDGGINGVICAKQAVIDFGVPGRDGVDCIVDVPTSSVGLAVNTVCGEKNTVYLNSGTGTSDLTGSQCSPNTVHWTYDTWMLAKSSGGATVKQGGDSWFFVTADYVFGLTLQRDTESIVKPASGKIVGSAKYPFPETTDFSSLLLQAKASGAKVLGLCNAGADTQNCIKQAQEFGLLGFMRVAAMLIQSGDIRWGCLLPRGSTGPSRITGI